MSLRSLVDMALRRDRGPHPRHARKETIDAGLAISIAGQLSVALMSGSTYAQRDAAMMAIALMLRNATDDKHVHETLAMIPHLRAETTAHGTRIMFTPPDEEDGMETRGQI